MNEQRWRKVEELFQAVKELPPEDHSVWLTRACSGDSSLLQEVQSLMDAHQRSGDFLKSPILGGVSQLIERSESHSPVPDRAGQRIGPYRLIREIATGGMGTVYLAERADEQYEKQVAIKLIRFSGIDEGSPHGGSLLERFRRERQVLATLEHPYIARLLDGGETEEGLPYLVMEYVEGKPIDVFCQESLDESASVGECLALFCRVCEAVQYAHQNLIIHRDLKPGNILITAEGTPKLLDFGLAKILDPHHRMTATTATLGGEIMGTFAYASPEQVSGTGSGGGGDQDTRSDVYALGMILYRILTGTHAYSVEGTLTDILRNITETQPAHPSTLVRKLRGDLDTIILKAIAKERDQRYSSVGALRSDILLSLAGEPIEARSDSRWYVLRKTARRYRIPLSIATGFLLLISVFAIFTARQSSRISQHATSLDKALRESNIERGRAMGMTGNHVLAEELLWQEYLRDREERSDMPSLLESGDGELLHSHWALWEQYARDPCLASFHINLSHPLDITRLPDGTWLVGGIHENRPAVRHIPEGQIIIPREATASDYSLLDLSPDGTFLAARDSEGQVQLWNLTTGSPPLSLLPPDDSITHLNFNADGSSLIAVSPSGLTGWATETGKPQPFSNSPPGGFHSFEISPDDRWMELKSFPMKDVVVWDRHTRTPLLTIPSSTQFNPATAFSSDSTLFAIIVSPRTLHVYSLPEGSLVTVITDLKDFVFQFTFFQKPDGDHILAASGNDKRMHFWEVPSGRPLLSFAHSTSKSNEISFSPDGSVLMALYQDMVKIWDTRPQGCLTRLRGHTDSLFAIAYSPDGRIIASAASPDDSAIRLWDADTGAHMTTLQGPQQIVAALDFSHDGTLLASAGYDGTVVLWTLNHDRPPRIMRGHRKQVFSLDFSPDDRRLVSAGDFGEICIWNTQDATLESELKQDTHRVTSVSWSSDGESLISTGVDKSEVFVWNWREKTSRRFPGHETATRIVQFSPRGDLFATGGDDQLINLYSPEGSMITSLVGHNHDIFSLSFHPNGRILASGDRGGIIKLWDIDARRLLATLDDGEHDMIFSLAFSPNGKKLVSAGRNIFVCVWDLQYYDRHIAGNLAYWQQKFSETIASGK